MIAIAIGLATGLGLAYLAVLAMHAIEDALRIRRSKRSADKSNAPWCNETFIMEMNKIKRNM